MVMLSSASTIVFTGSPPSARLRRGHAKGREQSVGVEQDDGLSAATQDAFHVSAAHPAGLLRSARAIGLRPGLLDQIHPVSQKTERHFAPVADDQMTGFLGGRRGWFRAPVRPERIESSQIVDRKRDTS